MSITLRSRTKQQDNKQHWWKNKNGHLPFIRLPLPLKQHGYRTRRNTKQEQRSDSLRFPLGSVLVSALELRWSICNSEEVTRVIRLRPSSSYFWSRGTYMSLTFKSNSHAEWAYFYFAVLRTTSTLFSACVRPFVWRRFCLPISITGLFSLNSANTAGKNIMFVLSAASERADGTFFT